MDFRIELRKKDFKKTFSDPRRKREEQQVQIRKQKREEVIGRKRQLALAEESNVDGEDTQINNAEETSANITPVNFNYNSPQIAEFAAAIQSSNPTEQFKACQHFRRLLSIERYPPIQEVIDANLVPQFVKFLENDDRPDLQFEAAWALTNIASGSSEQTKIVIDKGGLPLFVRLLKSPKFDIREQAVWALGNIAGDCPALRDLIFAEDGLKPLLDQLQQALNSPRTKISMLRNATWTLSNMCRGKPKPELSQISPALPILRELLFYEDADVLTDACWALSYLTDGNQFPQQRYNEVIINYGFGPRLVQLLSHIQPSVQTACLRAVGNIVSGTEQDTQAMVSCNCVPVIRMLLSSPKKTIQKEACWTISNITAGTPDQIQQVIANDVIPILVQLACPLTSEYETRKEAYWALANAASGAIDSQIPYLVEAKIIPPLANILIENGDTKLVESALEGIQNILRYGKELQMRTGAAENPYVVLFEEARAFPVLEQFQYQPSHTRTYSLVVEIMTKYMSIDETCEEYLEDLDEGPENNQNFSFQQGMKS